MRMDLPLAGDHASRFLPWLLALLVFLAALALAATLALQSALDRWNAELVGTLTVQVGGPGAETTKPAELDAQAKRAAEVIAKNPAVAEARVLSREDVGALLAPWFGANAPLDDLPLPRLIDVRLKPGMQVDARALEKELGAVAGGVAVEDHRAWLGNLARLARSVGLISLGVIGFIGFVAVVGTVFVTRTGLALHKDTIDILHMVGARDGYIARQFERHALRLCALGGVPGLILAALTAFAIERAGAALAPTLVPSFALDWRQWLALLAVPFAAAAIAVATARITVLKTLARAP